MDPFSIEQSLNYIAGASVMASKYFCESVGLMDESLFLYCEEQDWAWRGMQTGFRLAYAPDAIVQHKEGLTTGVVYRKNKLRMGIRLAYSRVRLAVKHNPLALPSVFVGNAYAGTRKLIEFSRIYYNRKILCNHIITLAEKVQRNMLPYYRKFLILIAQRKNILSAHKDRKKLLSKLPQEGKDIVVFLFPPNPLLIAGGLFSILNLASISRKILGDCRDVLISYYPKRLGLAKYPYFSNEEIIIKFNDLMRQYPKPKRLFIHIPEYCSKKIFTSTNSKEAHYLMSADYVHINILNQNILLMPQPEELLHLHALADCISQTAAHIAYCTQANADKWHIPLQYIGTVFNKKYPYIPYSQKEDWIAYSHDRNVHKNSIITELRKKCQKFKLIELSGLTYDQYLETISKSKYVITFGEGMDAYFIEPYYCGSIGCAVKNDIFFPKIIGYWETVYESYNQMHNSLPNDINKYENEPELYIAYVNKKYNSLKANIEQNWKIVNEQLLKLYGKIYMYYPKIKTWN